MRLPSGTEDAAIEGAEVPVFITVSQLLNTERQVEALLGSTHSPVHFL